nr:class I SAM-dependent methyltransferase [Protofrankia symbiont of Coriaria ruscifolia]
MPGLRGVPETLLWTLYHRAIEARRSDTVLDDPMGVKLVDSIDYPFQRHFGRGTLGRAQGQALRARCFDQEIRKFLSERPESTVVALGEGLETQFWRVDNGQVHWLTVDLPETVELRRRLLPAPPRVQALACSALDERWMDEIDEIDISRGVLVTAQGLLMYLQPSEVHRLIAACAQRFPGGALLFDGVPRWFAAGFVRGLGLIGHYPIPPMPWTLDAAERRMIRTGLPNVVDVRELWFPRGRGLFYGHLLPGMNAIPVVRDRLSALSPLSIMIARFATGGNTANTVNTAAGRTDPVRNP